MIKIRVKHGSIADETVDAIVNPANSYGMMGGGVAGVLKRIGGAIIEAEAMRQAPILVGTAALTQAGLLMAKHIIHAPTMERPAQSTTEENIRKAVRAALKIAEENKLSTIAMPGMGTGVGGFEPIDAAKAIIEEIRKFNADFLKEVVLIDISEDVVKVFEDALRSIV